MCESRTFWPLRCSRLHRFIDMRKTIAISMFVDFILAKLCSHWHCLQVRSSATNRMAGCDKFWGRKKPTNIDIAIVFRISISLWSRLHLRGQIVRDSHILVGFSLPLYPKDEAGKPTKMCELSHSFVGFFPTNMCEHFQLELRYLRTTVHKDCLGRG